MQITQTLLQQDHDAHESSEACSVHYADKILLRQIMDPGRSPIRFFYRRGGSVFLQVEHKEANDVEEYFIPGSIEWASIEHNIDIYFLLQRFSRAYREKEICISCQYPQAIHGEKVLERGNRSTQ